MRVCFYIVVCVCGSVCVRPRGGQLDARRAYGDPLLRRVCERERDLFSLLSRHKGVRVTDWINSRASE